jgi:hypothetical protein
MAAEFDKLNWVLGEVAVHEGRLLFKRGQSIHTIGTATTITVTAAQHGVMNPDGTWTVEEWEADP